MEEEERRGQTDGRRGKDDLSSSTCWPLLVDKT